jgi:hypothetical protein
MTAMHKEIFIGWLLTATLLAAFTVPACTGRDGKQTIAEPPATEQKAKAIESGPPPIEETAPTEETAPQIYTANTRPKITTFNIAPQIPVVGDTVRAEVLARAKDGDEITILYNWSKNDIVLPNTSDTLTLLPDDFKRGDKISVRATPEANRQKGRPATINLTIANAPPVIKSSPESFRFDGRVYTDQVKASDPDGDTLAYSIKSGPEGLTIDPVTGQISWNIPTDFKGRASITAAANDGQGSEAKQIFYVDITPGNK